jgi:PAS domain S-box-containing protein
MRCASVTDDENRRRRLGVLPPSPDRLKPIFMRPGEPALLQSGDQILPFGASMAEAALDSAVNAIAIIDADGIIQRTNPATEKLFGYASTEMLGRNVSMLMPDPYRSAHDSYVRNYLRTSEKRIIGIGREVLGQRKDGSTFPMHLSVGEFAVGGNRYFIGNIRDLTARRTAETESVRQRTLFHALFDSCPDAMIITDGTGDITLCNAATSQIFGYMPAELVGRPVRLLRAEGDTSPTGGEAAPAYAQEGRLRPAAVSFRRASGEIFPGNTLTTAITDPSGARLGKLTIVRDISREVAQEQAWRKLQRMEALGQLTGGIAHDFNNLLTIITGNHELLEFEIETDIQRDLLSRANDAAMMGARLTARLLTFARRRPLDAVLVDLNEHVLGMMDLLRRTIGETISLSASLAPNLWVVRSDLSEIESAVLNLAINARDAMPSGGKLILETRNVELGDSELAGEVGVAPGRYVRLSVSDTGTGMPPEVAARAFEPFFTTKPAGEGTGLGLSVIYGFAKQSGGHVSIYSELGRGTTVNVYLPCAMGDCAEDPAATGKEAASRAHSGKIILVVEDQLPVREVTMRRLRQLGYDVVEAEDARAAIDVLQSGAEVDLVFSDVVMPGEMTGFDLREWMRANRPDLPVILTSGFAEDVVRARESVEGSNQILRKPYAREDLIQAIERGLQEARLTPEPPRR